MTVKKKEAAVFEYQLLKEDLKADLLPQIETFPELETYCSTSRKGIKFTHYTGIVQTEGYQIEVLPKVWSKETKETAERNLMLLFTYAFQDPKLFERSSTLAKMGESLNLVDFLIRLYSISLKGELEKGLYRTYVTKRAVLNYLRGRLILNEQINKIDKSSFSVSEFNFTADNELNRFFRYSTGVFLRLTEDPTNIRNLKTIMEIIRDEVQPSYYNDRPKFSFNRINSRFEVPYNYSILIHESKIVKSGRGMNAMMFLFDMNRIFEQFLYNFLEKLKDKIFDNPQEIKIMPQSGGLNFLYRDEKPQRSTIPDILINRNDETILVIDTKYKQIGSSKDIAEEESLSEGNDRISMSDLYQMFTYSEIYHTDVLMVFPYLGRKNMEESYSFLREGKRLWIAWLNLDLEPSDWEENLISSIKEDVDKILSATKIPN